MYKHSFLWYNASINRVNASINSQFYLGLLSTSFSYRYPQLLLPLPGHITVTESDGSVPLLHHHRIATVIGQSVAEMAWIGLLSELLLFFGLLQGFADGAQASPAEIAEDDNEHSQRAANADNNWDWGWLDAEKRYGAHVAFLLRLVLWVCFLRLRFNRASGGVISYGCQLSSATRCRRSRTRRPFRQSWRGQRRRQIDTIVSFCGFVDIRHWWWWKIIYIWRRCVVATVISWKALRQVEARSANVLHTGQLIEWRQELRYILHDIRYRGRRSRTESMESIALMLAQYVDEYFIFSSVSSVRDSYVDEEIFACLKLKLNSTL